MAYASPSNHCDFAASRNVFYMKYIATVVTGVWLQVRWANVMPMRLLFVSSTSDIIFNPSAGAITDNSQDKDLYLKSQLYVKDPPPNICILSPSSM